MITIQQPELESLIMQRLHAGSFESVEQTLLDALTQAPPPEPHRAKRAKLTGEDIIAVFQRCPDKDFKFGDEHFFSPVSDPVKF